MYKFCTRQRLISAASHFLVWCRRRQKENQEDLLERVNQTTLQMLNKGDGAGGGNGGNARKITDLVAYKSVAEMQHNSTLTVQVSK